MKLNDYNSNQINNIVSIYNKLNCIEKITLKQYPNNILILYIKVKDYYINSLGYLINDSISNTEEIQIDQTLKEFNNINNKHKLILSSNINSQKNFGVFNNTYNNIEPIFEQTIYNCKNIKKKVKNKIDT